MEISIKVNKRGEVGKVIVIEYGYHTTIYTIPCDVSEMTINEIIEMYKLVGEDDRQIKDLFD